MTSVDLPACWRRLATSFPHGTQFLERHYYLKIETCFDGSLNDCKIVKTTLSCHNSIRYFCERSIRQFLHSKCARYHAEVRTPATETEIRQSFIRSKVGYILYSKRLGADHGLAWRNKQVFASYSWIMNHSKHIFSYLVWTKLHAFVYS